MSNIILPLLNSVELRGDMTAIIDCTEDEVRSVTYSQLVEDVKATSMNLKQAGFQKGDRIMLYIPMSYDTYRMILSILYIGAVVVFVDAWVDDKRFLESVKITNPQGIIKSQKYQDKFKTQGSIREYTDVTLNNQSINENKEQLFEDCDDEDEAIITFTTGSTGTPKAAKRTHGFFAEQHKVLSKYLDYNKDEINLVTFPIFLLSNLLSGITSVIPAFNPAKPSEIDGQVLVEEVEKFGVTSMTGSTALFEKLSKYIMLQGVRLDIAKVTVGGSPVFRSIAKNLCEAFPGVEIRVLYGATEAVPMSIISADKIVDWNFDYGVPVGKIISEATIKMIRPQEGPITLDSDKTLDWYTAQEGEIGEIIVAGPHVLKSYINNDEADKFTKIVDGDIKWHRTGDAGMIDKNGWLIFYGRVKNRISVKGTYYYPLPIEQRLSSLSNVSFAAVVQHNNRIIAAIEVMHDEAGVEKRITDEVKSSGIDFIDEFMILDKVPRDPRHNSKANYEEINRLCC